MTADPLAGGDNDKFEQATFSSPRISRSGTPLPHFSKQSSSHYQHPKCRANQLYDEYLFSEQFQSRGK